MAKLTMYQLLTSKFDVEFVLGSENLQILWAMWCKILDGPGPHNRVLILQGNKLDETMKKQKSALGVSDLALCEVEFLVLICVFSWRRQ